MTTRRPHPFLLALAGTFLLAALLAIVASATRAAEPADDFHAYLEHQVTALGTLGEAKAPDQVMLWADDQLTWARAHPPQPCYAEAFTLGVAAAEVVRAVAWMSTDIAAATVGSAYLDAVFTPMMAEWTRVVQTVEC